MKVRFDTFDCNTGVGMYDNGNLGIELIDEDGDLVTVATVNTGVILEKDRVAIKNYSENEGMVESLLKAGVITELVGTISGGFVSIPIYKISEEFQKEVDLQSKKEES